MTQPTLTWVLATRNKLDMLKLVLADLLRARTIDEEIIVVDGASSDGTAEYLRELRMRGLIDIVISEPDRGEAHAYNKALMIARGQLIKFISDDDIFDFPGINECKAWMLMHEEVDALSCNIAALTWWDETPMFVLDQSESYANWVANGKAYLFSGMGTMLRRSSLPFIGLLNTGVVWVDCDLSLRLCSLPVNLAWYTGYNFVRLTNCKSNSVAQEQRVYEDLDRLLQYYTGERASEAERSHTQREQVPPQLATEEWEQLYLVGKHWLEAKRLTQYARFLTRETIETAAPLPGDLLLENEHEQEREMLCKP